MSTWPRDLYTGPGGGMYTGPGGGLYNGPTSNHYNNNWPPIPILVKELRKRNMNRYADLIEKSFGLK